MGPGSDVISWEAHREPPGHRIRLCSPAELFLARRRGRHTDYRRFATAAEAIRYAVEELRIRRSLRAWMQVGDARFNKEEINRLYDEMIILCAPL